MDEIAQLLGIPAIAAKVTLAQRKVPGDTRLYVERVLRYCWTVGLSPVEIAEGRGLTGSRSLDRLTAACKAAAAVGLMGMGADGRYQVNAGEIARLKTLSQLKDA